MRGVTLDALAGRALSLDETKAYGRGSNLNGVGRIEPIKRSRRALIVVLGLNPITRSGSVGYVNFVKISVEI